MVQKLARAILGVVALVASPVSAQDVFSFDSRGLKVGDTFTHENDKGRTLETTYKAPGLYEKGDGSTMRRNADGNMLQNGETVFEPHSGIRPPGAGGVLVVGASWTHTYTQQNVERTRECTIEKREDLSVKAGLFPDAFKVSCVNRRSDRPLPRYEEIWFAANVDFEIKFVAKWGGSSPGTFSYELSEVLLAE